jgi:hypothetical protein
MKTRMIEVIIADKSDRPSDPDRVIAGSISLPDPPEVAGRSETKAVLVACPRYGALYYAYQIKGINLTSCPYCCHCAIY